MAFLYWLLPLIFLCSLIGTWMLRHYAVSRSILDVPNARSSHEVPTPRGGGVAVVVTFLAGLPVLAALGAVWCGTKAKCEFQSFGVYASASGLERDFV